MVSEDDAFVDACEDQPYHSTDHLKMTGLDYADTFAKLGFYEAFRQLYTSAKLFNPLRPI